MSVFRKFLESLDRSPTRGLLARYATWHARRVSGADVEVLFDRVWMHRIKHRYWADSHRFAYHRKLTPRWLKDDARQNELTRDFWFDQYVPQPGDVIVDIGAGVGTDLELFSQAVGPTGKVVAIEAHPGTFTHLERVVHWNQFENVFAVQKAVVDKPGLVTIDDSERHIANALQSVRASDGGGVEVEGCTLQGVCEPLGIKQIDFLKCNIEGAERFAIQGMTELLAATRFVCIACHDFRSERGEGDEFRTREEISTLLRQHGFDIYTREDDARDFVRDHVYGRNSRMLDNREPAS